MIPNHIRGHALWYAGAAHDEDGVARNPETSAGKGRAKCKCGELSPVFETGAERKGWHHRHKTDVWLAGHRQDDGRETT